MNQRCNQLHFRRRGGFSFTEILFAVMILGIGFIMVAAVFPVAIKQTEETVEETTAADIAKNAASYLQRIGTSANFPVTSNAPATPTVYGIVVPYTGWSQTPVNPTSASFWQQVSGNLVLGADTRFAWIPLYSRYYGTNGIPLPWAQVTIIAATCKNSTNFSSSDVTAADSNGNFNLEARPVTGTIVQGNPTRSPPTPDQVTFSGTSYANAVAEGCYLVVADDSAIPSLSVTNDGCVYRVGAFLGGTTWELAPGGDTATSSTAIHPPPIGGAVKFYLVGRGFNNASGGDTSLAGPAMDVAAYSTFIQIH